MTYQPEEQTDHATIVPDDERGAERDPDSPRHPFESPIPQQYGLKTLLVIGSLSTVFLWLASFGVGRGLLVFIAVIVFFFFLAACFSWLFGTAGEVQRRQEEESSELSDEEVQPSES
jgi:hypothetical protein